MTYRIVLQPRAEQDIFEAARFIRDTSGSSAPALRWTRRLRTKVDTLRANPERCPVDPDSVVYGREVRVLLFGKRSGAYRILFAIEGDAVHVLTVRHSARRSVLEEMEDGS